MEKIERKKNRVSRRSNVAQCRKIFSNKNTVGAFQLCVFSFFFCFALYDFKNKRIWFGDGQCLLSLARFPSRFFFGVSMATFGLILFDIFRRSHGSSSNGGGGHLWLIPFVGRRLRRRPIKKNVEMFFFGRIQQTIDSLSVEWTVTFLNKIELFHK